MAIVLTPPERPVATPTNTSPATDGHLGLTPFPLCTAQNTAITMSLESARSSPTGNFHFLMEDPRADRLCECRGRKMMSIEDPPEVQQRLRF